MANNYPTHYNKSEAVQLLETAQAHKASGPALTLFIKVATVHLIFED